MEQNGLETDELLRQAAGGDDWAIGRLFERHRNALKRAVSARLDERVAGRLDASDVVQDALGDAGQRLPEFLRERPVPFYSWLKRLTLLHLSWSHRFHLGSRKRSAARDRGLETVRPANSSIAGFDRLADTGTSPSQDAVRDEERQRVRTVLARLEGPDRTVLELRYFERLSLAEIADRLSISASAAKLRHLRALKRFRSLLEDTAEESAS
jgi:RNA polymerase sigma-70 factor (ECF subfamily)